MICLIWFNLRQEDNTMIFEICLGIWWDRPESVLGICWDSFGIVLLVLALFWDNIRNGYHFEIMMS